VREGGGCSMQSVGDAPGAAAGRYSQLLPWWWDCVWSWQVERIEEGRKIGSSMWEQVVRACPPCNNAVHASA